MTGIYEKGWRPTERWKRATTTTTKKKDGSSDSLPRAWICRTNTGFFLWMSPSRASVSLCYSWWSIHRCQGLQEVSSHCEDGAAEPCNMRAMVIWDISIKMCSCCAPSFLTLTFVHSPGHACPSPKVSPARWFEILNHMSRSPCKANNCFCPCSLFPLQNTEEHMGCLLEVARLVIAISITLIGDKKHCESIFYRQYAAVGNTDENDVLWRA